MIRPVVGSGAALIVALLVPLGEISAEPYLAVRTGFKCAQCHVNRTGGGGRNDFGSAWAQTQLPMQTAGVRSRRVADWIGVGLDLRALASGTVSESPTSPRTAFEIPEAQVQLEARLIPAALAVYVDETVGPERAVAREAFALVEGLPVAGYAKAGKFLLPFGWRLWDDPAYIRTETGFTYRTPDVGIELGIEPGPLSWSVALTNGTLGTAENDSEKMITSSAALVFPAFRVGASASRNSARTSRRDVVGGFAGVALGPLAVLGEADWILDRFDALPGRDQFVAYAEGDLLARQGVNLKVTWGYHDPDLDVAEDWRTRMRFGLETFPVSFVQLSAFYTLLADIPQVTTDRDVVSVELHVHF